MRIIQSLEGSSWSGGQQQAFFLVQEMARLGHDLLLVCQQGSVLAQRAREAGLPVHPHDFRKEMNPRSIIGLQRIFREFKPDVVNVHRAWAHTQWLLVSILQRFHGLVVTRRVLFAPDANPVSRAKYRSRAVRGYIAVSRAVADRLTEVGVDRRRIRVVYSATDMGVFDPNREHALAKPLPVPEGVPLGLLVGNFHRNKGHLLLLEAFREMAGRWPQLHLAMAGTRTDEEPLKGLAAASGLGERIHLLGFRTDVPALLARSAFSVNASFEEGFSGTMRESLAMGVPVLASDSPANLEIAAHVPCRIFASGNRAELAAGLAAMREFPTETRARLRTLAAPRFSVPAMVEATVQAYRSLVRPR